MKFCRLFNFYRDRKARIPNIKQNIHESIYDIVSHMNQIDPPTKPANETTKSSIEFILNLGSKEPEEYTEVGNSKSVLKKLTF